MEKNFLFSLKVIIIVLELLALLLENNTDLVKKIYKRSWMSVAAITSIEIGSVMGTILD